MINFGMYREFNTGAHLSANEAKSQARQAGTEVQLLRAEVDRLYMITEALWSILKERAKLDEQVLIEAIKEVDLKDGKLDGRTATTTVPGECLKCGRTVSRRRPLCSYCGTPVEVGVFER